MFRKKTPPEYGESLYMRSAMFHPGIKLDSPICENLQDP